MAVKKLVLLAVLILLATALCAQDGPLCLGGKAFVLPEGWPQSYDPPEVLLRVKVNPDSTLGLVAVLDGKTELEPLLSQHLMLYEYIPSSDFLAEFDAILEILSPPEIPAQASTREREQLLEEIEETIARERESLNFRSPLHPPAEQTALNSIGEPYRSGYYFYGLPENTARLSLRGFEQRSSLFSRGFQDLFALGFLNRQESLLEQAYGRIDHPYQVTLSAIEVGIGGYEQLFGRGLLRKNRLFGIDRLQLGFGFLIQDGAWLQRDSGREAVVLDISLPLGKTTLDLAVTDHRDILSQRYLRYEYWRSQDFSVERRHRTIFAAWRSPWLDLALLHEHDLATAAVFTDTLRDDALRFRAWKNLRIGALSLTPLYERMFVWRDFTLANDDHSDLLGLDIGFEAGRIGAEAIVRLKDFQRLQASADLDYSLGRFRFGALGSFRYREPEPVLRIPSPYSPGDSLSRVEIRDDAHLGLFLNWLWDQNSLNLSGGRRVVFNQPIPYLVPNHQNLNYLRLGVRIDQTWNNWNLVWQPGLVWQGGFYELFLEPELRYQSHLNISRLLSHHNALFAGFFLLGHSSFVTPDPDWTVWDDALVIDIWAGVKIGRRFDFQVTYKNLLDSRIYDAEPLPGSLQASLRWYFLN